MVKKMEKKQNTIICTVANLITFLGIIFALISIYYVTCAHDYVTGFVFFVLAGISDFFDGFFARFIEKRKPGYGISRFVEILDPIRDKLLILIVVFINLKIGVLICIAELTSMFASYLARTAAGYHVVTTTSKVITASQLVLSSFLFFIQDDDLFFLFLILSCVRGASYILKYKTLKRSPKT